MFLIRLLNSAELRLHVKEPPLRYHLLHQIVSFGDTSYTASAMKNLVDTYFLLEL